MELGIGPVRCFGCARPYRASLLYQGLAKFMGPMSFEAYNKVMKQTNDYEQAMTSALLASEYQSIGEAFNAPNIYDNLMTYLFQVPDERIGTFRPCCARNVEPYFSQSFVQPYDRESASDIRGSNPTPISSNNAVKEEIDETPTPAQKPRVLSTGGSVVKKTMIPQLETSMSKMSIGQTTPTTPPTPTTSSSSSVLQSSVLRSSRLSPRNQAKRL